MDKTFSSVTPTSHYFFAFLSLSVLVGLSIGLMLVWVNIEKTKISYNLQGQQAEVDLRLELHSKLLVERDHLLSPHTLGAKANTMGLHIAKPGQIRRLGTFENERGGQ